MVGRVDLVVVRHRPVALRVRRAPAGFRVRHPPVVLLVPPAVRAVGRDADPVVRRLRRRSPRRSIK